jgi:hypothetical protein
MSSQFSQNLLMVSELSFNLQHLARLMVMPKVSQSPLCGHLLPNSRRLLLLFSAKRHAKGR